ncbi:hypothetical protein IEQ34_000400 [Dendrobium chrysotoxum]|uniref:Uncharacterized protein n=1 Tax=Dendrobium chrysotoxum TaxID=161865 RepID=A0AAV7HQD6_DENCH|nr:hypothetical protein IEQ34_000400 [Dendrobium chrysotoxum]
MAFLAILLFRKQLLHLSCMNNDVNWKVEWVHVGSENSALASARLALSFGGVLTELSSGINFGRQMVHVVFLSSIRSKCGLLFTRNFCSLPASPPFRGKTRVIACPPRQERRARSVSWDTAAVVFFIHHAKKGVHGSSRAHV